MMPIRVILPTALVYIYGSRKSQLVKVLISPGPAYSIILLSTVEKYQLYDSSLFGEYMCFFRLQSRLAKFRNVVRPHLNVNLFQAIIDLEIQMCYSTLRRGRGYCSIVPHTCGFLNYFWLGHRRILHSSFGIIMY